MRSATAVHRHRKRHHRHHHRFGAVTLLFAQQLGSASLRSWSSSLLLLQGVLPRGRIVAMMSVGIIVVFGLATVGIFVDARAWKYMQ